MNCHRERFRKLTFRALALHQSECISRTDLKERKRTLFKCLVILVLEHYNWGHYKLKLTINTNRVKCWFLRRGETGVPEKTSPCRVENQQTKPTYDTGSGNPTGPHWWECSHHCAIPAPQSRTYLSNHALTRREYWWMSSHRYSLGHILLRTSSAIVSLQVNTKPFKLCNCNRSNCNVKCQ